MTEAKHTPTPWFLIRPECIGGPVPEEDWARAAEGEPPAVQCGIAAFNMRARTQEEAVANAAFVVRAVNAHDDLVAALQAQHVAIDRLFAMVIGLTHRLGEPAFLPSKSPMWPALVMAQAALAKASPTPAT